MANRTINAYIEHLDIARKEVVACQSASQIVGVSDFDRKRQETLVAAALQVLMVPVCDTPKTHPEVSQS